MVKRRVKTIIFILFVGGLLLANFVLKEFTTETLKEFSEKGISDENDEEYSQIEANINLNVTNVFDNPEAQAVFDELERLNGEDYEIITNEKGYITFLKGTICDKPFDNEEYAAEILKKVMPVLSANTDTKLELAYMLYDDLGNQFVTYTESVNGESVVTNVVKFILDENGYMKGLCSSIVPYYQEEGEPIESKKAIDIVEKYLAKNYSEGKFTIMTVDPKKDYRYLVDPISLQEYSANVYIVLSDNPDSDIDGIESPFIEHYVSEQGKYLGAAPSFAMLENDEERNFESYEQWFENDEAEEYTVSYEALDGKNHTITVPVVYDGERYYLEDPKRKILCAEYYDFAYANSLNEISSENNEDWDLKSIIAYHNYIVSYDFYAETGWIGPDGLGGPMLLLMNYEDYNHNPVDNLCYLGNIEDVNIFTATTEANDYYEALDVIGHEYTHAVTSAILANVRYANEPGAINEALSDIMGECIELKHYEDEGDDIDPEVAFCVADKTGTVLRDLVAPDLYGQPEFSGGEFYVPQAALPSSLNDYGGVHINSSLISMQLPYMYYETDLEFDDIRRIWGTVMCMLVPKSGYQELREILPMACEMSGYKEAISAVEKCLEYTDMGVEDVYDYVDAGTSQINFSLPPWVDWNRVRMEVTDSKGKLRVSWPKKGSNKMAVTVTPGRYNITLIQYDKGGNLVGAWKYTEAGWITGDEVGEDNIEIPKGKYQLKDISYGNSK